MKHPYNRQKTSAVWDYDIQSLNFSNPWVMRWYLARRINYADWRGLRKADIKKHLPRLDISTGMRQLLATTIHGTHRITT